MNFTRGAKSPALMAVESTLDEATATITLSHPTQGKITFRPDDAADLPRFLEWVGPLTAAGRALPTQIVSAGRGMTDSDFPSVSILSTTSLADLSARMGIDLSPHRFRGNLWIDGAAPWDEFNWIGRHIRIGDAILQIKERITRCVATKVDPTTGTPNADTLSALDTAFGHQDFGVFAIVTQSGPIAIGDDWSLT